MKKILLIATFLLPLFVCAQSDSTKIHAKEVYCMIMAATKPFSNKFNITVDYGQEMKLFKDSRLRDDSGKLMTFNSVVDALNYMAEQGWEYVNVFVVNGTSQSVYHYVMRKSLIH